MAGEPPTICTQCGYKLGSSEDEVAHPDDPDPPDDPHFKVQIRDDDEERLQCVETGRLAAVAGPGDDSIGSENMSYAELFYQFHDETPPGMGEPEGGGREPTQDEQRQQRQPGGIYEIDEEKSQLDIVNDVVTNPRYGLNDDHIQEVREWAEDMDGRLPPQTLQDILQNLSGIQKQTAKLIRQRYELKLNKWMRDQSGVDEGPPIGVTTGPMPQQNGSQPQRSGPTPKGNKNKKQGNQSPNEEQRKKEERQARGGTSAGPSNLREFRRRRRTKRRQETMDIAAQRVAEQAADEIARELVGQFGGILDIPRTVLQRKAEKDPDWFLEKAEQLDIDILEIMEPSEQRKKEMGADSPNDAPEVDHEVDNALEQIQQQETQPAQQSTETNNNSPKEGRDGQPMSASPDENGFTPEPDKSEPEPEEDQREGAEMFD